MIYLSLFLFNFNMLTWNDMNNNNVDVVVNNETYKSFVEHKMVKYDLQCHSLYERNVVVLFVG